MKAWKAELALFSVTSIWGGTFIFTKLGLQDCPPSLYLIFRFGFAFILSFIFFGRHLLNITRKDLKHGIILGLFFGAGFVLQTYGLKYTSVSKSAFITGLSVVLTPFVFWIVERKSIAVWQKIGVLVAFIGLWIFTKPTFDNVNIGDVMTFFSTFFWALYITYMDVFTRGTDKFSFTAQIVMAQFIGATPVALISLVFFDFQGFYFNPTSQLFVSLAYNSILASFVLTFIHTGFQKYTTPVKAALIFSLEPILASFNAYVFLHERLISRELIGAAVLMGGILISEAGEFTYKNIRKLFVSK